MRICEICGAQMAGSNEGYKAHVNRFHNVLEHPRAVVGAIGDGSTGKNGARVVMPIRTSRRTFEQIVQETEWAVMGKNVLPDTRPVKF